MAVILDGRAVAESLRKRVQEDVASFRARGIVPTIATVRVGEREDDAAYERSTEKRCRDVGIEMRKHVLPADAAQEDVISLIRRINADDSVHGCMVYLPLPRRLDEAAVRAALAPEKDIDGITPASQRSVYAGTDDGFAPCTAAACMALLDHYGIEVEGKHCVAVGRSLVVGRPLFMLMLARGATVTVCHTKTRDLPSLARQADILVCAAGRTDAVTADCLTPEQVVLDVGIHFVGGRLRGDLDPALSDIPRAVTPVPGGIGAITTTILACHTVQAVERQLAKRRP